VRADAKEEDEDDGMNDILATCNKGHDMELKHDLSDNPEYEGYLAYSCQRCYASKPIEDGFLTCKECKDYV